jgi:aspartyl-tRNA(Asn)/glutamyl-tRNA(Gln) amidotransferase subunit C
MEINEELIVKLEKLSKLELSEDEREIIKKDLGNILDMINEIQEVDTTNVEPLQYVNERFNAFREDIPENEISNKEALKNAPETEGPYIKVPKVINI